MSSYEITKFRVGGAFCDQVLATGVKPVWTDSENQTTLLCTNAFYHSLRSSVR